MKTNLEPAMQKFTRWFLAAVLVLAAISKVTDPEEFYGNLLAYEMPLPGFALKLVAYGLPWLELLLGVLLFARICPRVVLVCAIILFAIFAIATGQAWARGLNIACGCFKLRALGINLKAGPRIEHLVESPAFACLRALVLLAATLWLFSKQLRTQSLRPSIER
jgi:uncharacterized membrane protein YphA (DoxX/SURF4 family)